jgi:septal ring factor EnvC (AmiA/AmiB activator)
MTFVAKLKHTYKALSVPLISGTRAILLCTLVGAAMSDVHAQANTTVEDVEQEISQTQQKLKQLDAEIAEGRALKAKLEKALQATNKNVGERASRIEGLNTDIAQYNAKLDQLETRITQEQANVERRKQSLAVSIRRAQSVTTANGLKVVLQNDNPALIDRLNVYTDYFMQAQQTAIDEQLHAIEKIEAAHFEALKNRNWLNHIKKKATNQYATYKQDAHKKQRSLGEVNTDISTKTRTVAQLKADQVRLQTLMEELKTARIAQSGYFKAGQGTYGLPVAGTVESRFGDVKSVGKLRWNGYFISARSGTPVRAIADGAVIYRDWLQGFGMLVILDHGDGYMTLYGGNREVNVQNEDWVESGATIATVGDSGGQKVSGVYFEIRHNAKPIDPKGWVDAKNSVKTAKK